MAKNKVEIDVTADDKGSLKKVTLSSKKAGESLDSMGKSAQTADRNIKGASQQSANSTKNFSKMAQGMGGLVAVYATLAAQVFAVSAAYQFLRNAVDYKNLIEGQKALGAVTGVAYKTISNSLVEATNGQLKYADAAKAAAIGSASGISPTQLERLGSAAKNASIALGRDLTDSFDRLIRGVTKAEPELLDELGIILRLDTATSKYAAQIGKSANSLNEFERSQAVANEVLEQAERKFGAMEKLMDPTSAALNQFGKAFDDIGNTIRSTIAGPISSLAIFLSENIPALIGSLSLFAASILKQILPSMSAWKTASEQAMKQNKIDQEAIRAELAKTRIEYEKLNTTQKTTMQGAAESSATILAGMSGSKTGQGAFDFLTGSSDTSRAQKAADKALSHAENQLENSLEKRTGMLADYTEEEIKQLRDNYNRRAGILAEGEVTWSTKLKKMNLSWKSFMLSLKSGNITIKSLFSSLGSGLATIGNVISKFVFWASILSLVFSVGKTVYDALFPATEEQKKLNEAVDKAAEKYATLTEEINRTNQALSSPGLLNATERIEAIGKAVSSSDVSRIISDINNLNPKAEKYEELKNNLTTMVDELIRLDPRFKELKTSLEKNEKVGDKTAISMRNYSNELIQAGLNSEKLPSLLRETEKELTKLIGTFEKPFASNFFTASSKSIPALQQQISELNKQLLQEEQNLVNTRKEYTQYVQERIPQQERQATAAAQGVSIDVVPTFRSVAKELTAAQQEALDALNKQYAESVNRRNQLTTALQFQTILTTKLKDRAEEINSLRANTAKIEKEIAQNQTLGITAAQKIKNLENSNLGLTTKQNSEKESLILLEAKRDTLADQLSKKENATNEELKQQKAEIDRAVIAQQNRLKITGLQISLETTKNNLLIDDLRYQEQILELIKQQNDERANTQRLELQRKAIEGGLTGSYGFARSEQLNQNQLSILQSKVSEANTALAKATSDAQRAFDGLYDTVSLEAYDRTVVAEQQAKLNAASASQELAIYKARTQEVILSARAETELAAAKLETLSMNPVEQQFQERLLELRKQKINLSTAEQKSLYAEIEAQYGLNQLYEMKAGLFDSLTNNITSAFTAMVDGSKSAKQAFADMAVAILKDIATMITRMLVMRMLMSLFPGFGGPAGGVPTNLNMSGYTGVADGPLNLGFKTGGIFSNGKKMSGYATGGVASGPNTGYPALLHGTEAIVPLPNGKSIPVDIRGSGQNNNVVVNVSVDNQGRGQTTTESQSGTDAGNLGQAIARAVQQELQNQKRSGGILNPYGVS